MYRCWSCIREIFFGVSLDQAKIPDDEDVAIVDRPLARASIERPMRKSQSTPSLLKLAHPLEEAAPQNTHPHNPHVGYFLVHGRNFRASRRLPPRPILKRRVVARRSISGTFERKIRFSDRVTVPSPLVPIP